MASPQCQRVVDGQVDAKDEKQDEEQMRVSVLQQHRRPIQSVACPPIDRRLSSSTGSSKAPRDILEQKELGPKLIIFMVGLPARGKSYICKKLVRYLSWSGFNTRVFNVGNRRRVMATSTSSSPPPPHEGPHEATHQVHDDHVNSVHAATESHLEPPHISVTPPRTLPSDRADTPELLAPIPKVSYKPLSLAHLLLSKFNNGYHGPVPEPCPSPVVNAAPGTTHDAKFFDPDNPEAKAVREKLAMDTLEEIFEWLHGGGKVAIHDATNSTVQRRRALLDRVKREKGVKAMFIESICTDKRVLDENIRMKLQGPDYKNMPPEEAMRDFLARTANYERAYETICEDEERQDDLEFIKLVNVGKKVIANNVHGYLESQCVFYLMQMHIKPRTIWLTRHGESGKYCVWCRVCTCVRLCVCGFSLLQFPHSTRLSPT
ncbi:hypothetical protein, variant [Spizellomyces punctatus DAOM BR117]|uniref:6-phosphofructo-2-kinase domain-containing protein n=1 Tax=Spizellomyces punctatus (strain DAOM BR117) TaxID=645134 RepID=A0A0L0H5S8_SPIPD|nr:hypothetical protein, variant [Spizellomyces punctatus DAOM BR117]KNC96324.1 hypothetical protein, variant [Spizellomyces punctatus DAOM BR117]|eukprot:XP_016604364.1 hypothetical protein, variant [Spizellomyces punctatus DAOM BR117]